MLRVHSPTPPHGAIDWPASSGPSRIRKSGRVAPVVANGSRSLASGEVFRAADTRCRRRLRSARGWRTSGAVFGNPARRVWDRDLAGDLRSRRAGGGPAWVVEMSRHSRASSRIRRLGVGGIQRWCRVGSMRLALRSQLRPGGEERYALWRSKCCVGRLIENGSLVFRVMTWSDLRRQPGAKGDVLRSGRSPTFAAESYDEASADHSMDRAVRPVARESRLVRKHVMIQHYLLVSVLCAPAPVNGLGEQVQARALRAACVGYGPPDGHRHGEWPAPSTTTPGAWTLATDTDDRDLPETPPSPHFREGTRATSPPDSEGTTRALPRAPRLRQGTRMTEPPSSTESARIPPAPRFREGTPATRSPESEGESRALPRAPRFHDGTRATPGSIPEERAPVLPPAKRERGIH